MCVFLRWQLGLVYTPEAWHYPHHFWLTLVLRRRERVRKRWEKEHRGKQNVWWENTPHETHPVNIYSPDLSPVQNKLEAPYVLLFTSVHLLLHSYWPACVYVFCSVKFYINSFSAMNQYTECSCYCYPMYFSQMANIHLKTWNRKMFHYPL